MAQRESDEGLPVGIRPAPGKMRRKPDAARIAARVARFADVAPLRHPNVMLLNPGFFQLERMRASSAAKKRGKTRAKVRGK